MKKYLQPITVRKLSLDLEKAPSRHWWGGKIFVSHWFNSLSQGLPRAEFYASNCVKQALPHVDDPALRVLARGFVGQEASHTFVHNACNKALEKQGLRFILEGYTKWRLSKAHWLNRHSGLAVTVSWEHITSTICEHTLMHTDLPAVSDEPFRALWMWHCAEELEHQSLTHDIYVAAGGGYFRKVGWYLYGTYLFVTDFAMQTTYNLYCDKQLFSPKVWGEALQYFFGSNGLFWFGFPRWLKFFSPSFHPSNFADEELVAKTLAVLDKQLATVKTHAPELAALVISVHQFRLPEREKSRKSESRRFETRALLCEVLGEHIGRKVSDRDFIVDKHGKPELASNELHFNLSHSGGWLFVAVSKGRVGVDIESERTTRSQFAFERYLRGRCRLDKGGQEQPINVARIWSRFEALTKCIGLGMTISLSQFQLPSQELATPEQINTPYGGVWLVDLPAPGGFRASLAGYEYPSGLIVKLQSMQKNRDNVVTADALSQFPGTWVRARQNEFVSNF